MDAFQQSLRNITDSCISHKYTSSRHDLTWFNPVLKRQTEAKRKLYNKAERTGKEADWTRFKIARKDLTKNLRKARNAYMTGYLTDTMQENPKAFSSYFKRLRQDNPGVRDFRVYNEIICDAGTKSEVRSREFASIFTNENTENLPTLGTNPAPNISGIVISVKGVENQLISLNSQKASGSDGIP